MAEALWLSRLWLGVGHCLPDLPGQRTGPGLRGRRARLVARGPAQPGPLRPGVRIAVADRQPLADQGGGQLQPPGPEGRFEQRALHRVALRVTAAERVHLSPDRQQLIEHAAVLALAE